MIDRFQKKSWLLAFHWTAESVHFVLARRRGQHAEIVSADSHVLDDGATIDGLASRLTAELQRHGAKKPVLLVALSRSYVDVLPVTLPSATDEELPSLVELQVMQQLPDTGENAVIDFVTIDQGQSEERKILAFVLRAGTMDFVRSICAGIGAKLQVITFRPLATLSLHRRTALSATGTSIVATPLADEADIAILRRGALQAIRTVHLGSGPESRYTADLASEIQRTLLLTPTHDDEKDSPEEAGVVVLADPEHDQEMLDELGNSLSTNVHALHAFRVFGSPRGSQSPVGTYAPLLGLIDQHLNSNVDVNFLCPRRPTAPPSAVRKYSVYAITAASLLGAMGYFVYQARTDLSDQIDGLRGQVGQLDRTIAKLESKRLVAATVENWEAQSVNWLDELRDISLRFPRPNDAFLQRLTMANASGGDSVMSLQVRVQEPAIVGIMETNLRDEYHRILSKRVAERSDSDEFGWQFETTILLRPREPVEYIHYLDLDHYTRDESEGTRWVQPSADAEADTASDITELPPTNGVENTATVIADQPAELP